MTIDKLRFKQQPARAPATGAGVVVEGRAPPGSEIVVENQSLAPFAPNDTPDVFARVKVGADGNFSLTLPAAREGDRLRLTQQSASSSAAASALSVRLQNVEPVDGRPPVVRQQGLRLVAVGARGNGGDGGARGAFAFAHVCKSTVVGEPGQLLQLKNLRSGATTLFTLDDDGRLPAGARVDGSAGDTFTLATSDGTHNVDFARRCGELVAPPATNAAEPPASVTTPNAKLAAITGPLFADGGPHACSVKQGQVGDCWFVSAADALASTKPDVLRRMMRDNGDGTFTVTFKRYDHERKRYVDEPVTVTNQLYVRASSAWGASSSTAQPAPLYGSSSKGELWFPILEKAYAQWKSGYDGARSGYPFEAFEALLGAEGRHYDLDVTSTDALWAALSKRLAPHPPGGGDIAVGWTRVESKELGFANSGLAQDHAYAVLGVDVDNAAGKRLVTLRNPWGSGSWTTNPDVKSLGDGVIQLPVELFAKYFGGVGVAPTS